MAMSLHLRVITMTGKELLQQIIALSGLPEALAQREVEALALQKNKNIDDLTLDDIRYILTMYLQDVLLSTKKELAEIKPSLVQQKP